jgi:hypothetical protein
VNWELRRVFNFFPQEFFFGAAFGLDPQFSLCYSRAEIRGKQCTNHPSALKSSGGAAKESRSLSPSLFEVSIF